ncbi:hypothetical protein Droror1_Dr00027550 [Drosera rotundifolia]
MGRERRGKEIEMISSPTTRNQTRKGLGLTISSQTHRKMKVTRRQTVEISSPSIQTDDQTLASSSSKSKVRQRSPDLQYRCSLSLFDKHMVELNKVISSICLKKLKMSPFSHFLYTLRLLVSSPRLKGLVAKFN